MDELLKQLKDPPKEFRPAPFWSWNDKLEPEVLKWQIGEMDRAGIGGYFMHARGGLRTEYLGEDWMECVRACIQEGYKYGMNSWCYDEEGWPSGFAGGVVTALGDGCHVRWLEKEEFRWGENSPDDSGILGYYRLAGEGYVRVNKESLEPGEKVTVVRHRSNPYYIDILNEEVIREFIKATHEKYYRRFKDDFGKGMRGFFTDEPQFSREKIPWSCVIPGRFVEKYGYELIEELPFLFCTGKGYEKVRYDFWALVNELYVKSFGKQIYDWCEEHQCKLTGHVMAEDSLFTQMCATAGGMPFYEYMHIPGMDWLSRKIGNPVIPRQVGSAASQLGKEAVLSETFALCGWDVSWEELKWIAEWQYVNGVNLLCQHLEGYTLKGLRKRDYPPSMFYQQSWWEEYRLFNDYFARLGMLLASGEQAVDVLLLHPMKSAWVAYDGGCNERLQKLDEDFAGATELLSGLHIDHHYGDETILKRHGRIEGNRFIVGKCRYKAVVLPSMLTIDRHTADLLNQFIDNGGRVIAIGDFPVLCEGRWDGTPACLRERVQFVNDDRESLYNVLKQLELPVISIADNGAEIESIRFMQRNLGDTQIFFLVNHHQGQTFNADVSIKGSWKAKLYRAEKNELEDTSFSDGGGSTCLKLEFLPMQSHILILNGEGGLQKENTIKPDCRRIRPGSDWTIGEMDLNSLTLDYCGYSIDNGEWAGPAPVIKLMDILLGLKRDCDISLKFSFEVGTGPDGIGELYLVLEAADEFEISVNGRKVQYRDIGWWKDISFKKVDIRSFAKEGDNEVVLTRKFHQQQKVYEVLFGENILETEKNRLTFDTELESIYIVGDFGVASKSGYTFGERKAVFTDGPFVITDKPRKVSSGDLTEQGLCFFAGSIKLSQNIVLSDIYNSRIEIDLGKPNAAISRLFVNGRPVKVLPWPPYRADITDYIKEGENTIAVQLFAGNRNLLGPHHHIDGELYGVAPASFTDREGWEGAAGRSVWTDRYCFVRFGLEEDGE